MKTDLPAFFAVKFVLGLVMTITLTMTGDPVFAQPPAGSTLPKRAETKDKADQNLRSVARVNPHTLGMELTVPIASYPGRNGSVVPIDFRYSSKVWTMQDRYAWWYYNVAGQRRYLTDTTAVYARRSAAGWTSGLMPPRIDDAWTKYNLFGQPYGDSIDGEGLDNIFTQNIALMGDGPTSEISWGATYCFMECTGGWIRYCRNNECTEWSCRGWNTTYCLTGSSPDPAPAPGTPNYTYYVKRLNVTMSDGSPVEFRQSDEHNYCGTGGDCATDFNGTYLAVDGSGMRLERGPAGSVLYLSSGAKYTFPATAQGPNGLYATEYEDADGNRMTFREDPAEVDRDQKWIDTVGREIIDPIPHNAETQAQPVGSYPVLLPDGRSYELTWDHLKAPGCEASTDPNCVGREDRTGGALEDQSEKLFYEARNLCRGSITENLLANPNDPNDPANEVLFPNNGIGIRPCTSLDVERDEDGNPVRDGNGNPIPIAVRSNPVVLSNIKLPDGSVYSFRYNRHGEISKVIYPTGAYETFAYGHITPLHYQEISHAQTNRGVTERSVFSEDGLQQRWTYSVNQTGTYPNVQYKVTATAPRGDNPSLPGARTETLLYVGGAAPFGFDDPRSGRPFDERVFDESGALKSRTLTEHVSKDVSINGFARSRDLRMKRTISTVFESGNALATMSELEYDDNGHSDPAHFSHLNVKRKKTHHYKSVSAYTAENGSFAELATIFSGAVPAQVEEFDYSYNANYKARGISSLQTESRQIDPSNNAVLSKLQVVYDNQAPLPASTYPAGYSLLGYSGVTSSLNCANAGQPERICWNDPGLSAPRGNQTTSRVWNRENNTWIESHTRFDIFGNSVATLDPLGAEAKTEFASAYRHAFPTKVIAPAPDPNGIHGTNQTSSVESTYDLASGLTLTVKDDFGQITRTIYDGMLRPTRIFGENFLTAETQYVYGSPNASGQLPADQRFVRTRKQLDATNWNESTAWSDSLGRTIKTQGKDSQGDIFVETAYDALGRVSRVTNPYRVGETVYWSKTRYDAAGRAVETFAPATLTDINSNNLTSVGTTAFDLSTVANVLGTVAIASDASGRKKRSITNALDQLVRVDEPISIGGTIDADLGSLASPHQPTFYSYSPQGKMVHVQQGVQNRYLLYDSLGRLVRVRQPEQEVNNALSMSDPVTGNSQWTAGFSYDAVGNVLTATDARNVTISSTYDRASRPKTRTFTNEAPGPSTPPVNFFYDGKGLDSVQTPHNFAKGKLTKVDNSVSQTRYTFFDNLGRLKQMEQRTPVGSETTQSATARVSKYTYNLAGALVDEEYPSGRIVRNAIDSDGDLTSVSSKKTGSQVFVPYASGFSYTAVGGVSQMRLGNGKWETTKFNSRLQVTELTLGSSVADAGLWKVNYEYGELDANGTVIPSKNTGDIARQVLWFSGLMHPFDQTYRYDTLHRLREARETANGSQNWRQDFEYDRYGNRTAFSQNIGGTSMNTTPSVDPNSNRFNGGQGFSYDKNGNVVVDVDSGSSRSFVFNGDNRQTEVRLNGVVIGRYFYDGEGRRVKKQIFSSGQISEETVFVYSSGKLIAEYSTQLSSQPTINYLTTDHLESPRVITNQYGQVTSRRDFLPFGAEIANTVGGRSGNYGGGDDVRQKFTGYQKDTETQLDFAEARMYENRYARFTAVDPLLASGQSAEPQSFNRYIYVMNRPLIMVDPTGEVGDYYTFDGRWIRSDGKKDNKVYVSLEVMSPKDPKKIEYVDTLLPVTIQDFRRMAGVLRREGTSKDSEEYLWFAHSANNEATARGSTMLRILLSGWSAVPGARKTSLADSDRDIRADHARAGLIHVLSGGKDPTDGARYFDGTDFLAWGLRSPYKAGAPHAKFRQYSQIEIEGDIYAAYLKSQASLYSSGRVSYKTNGVRAWYNIPATVFRDQGNWNKNANGGSTFRYTTKAVGKMRLIATGARGQSVFWKVQR